MTFLRVHQSTTKQNLVCQILNVTVILLEFYSNSTVSKEGRFVGLARKIRRRRLSKKVMSGLLFIGTSVVGGFISSVGTDLYHTIKSAFSNQLGFPLSIPQIIFLIIGLAGIGLMLSGFADADKSRIRRKTRELLSARCILNALIFNSLSIKILRDSYCSINGPLYPTRPSAR